MIDTLLRRPPAPTLPPAVEAPPAPEDEDEDMAEVWAALERSCDHQRPSRPSDAVAS